MVFSSLLFLFFYLPATLLVYYLVPSKWRNLWLFLVNLVFYGWEEKLYVLREADWIFRSEIEAAKVPDASQYFAVLTNTRSVGVMGDGRTYEYTLALRCVSTTDFMTATFTRIPYELLEKISHRIVNEVPHINRVVYDITAKPPATVEWE